MKNITPYLKALKAFEITARHQSFSLASEELFVTPAAVGQLVKSLEDGLGVSLFHRHSGGLKGGQVRLTLTNTAKNALPDIVAGFARLEQGFAKLTPTNDNQLTITVSPAFASKWLLSRLEQFQSLYPDIDVRLHTDSRHSDFTANDIDIGIRYGGGEWAGLQAEKLMDEQIFPVCSPDFSKRFSLLKIGHLLGANLIHDTTLDEAQGFMSWANWFECVGLPKPALWHGLKINSSSAVLQSAIDGQGVALARSVMAQQDLQSGRLIRLYPEYDYPSKLCYFVVYPKHKAEKSAVKVFKEWVLTVARGG